MPAVLIETGFLSNRFEEANLRRWRFKNEIADSIVKGVKSYERKYIFTEGFRK